MQNQLFTPDKDVLARGPSEIWPYTSEQLLMSGSTLLGTPKNLEQN